jgi:small subunit ribosomal protein S17
MVEDQDKEALQTPENPDGGGSEVDAAGESSAETSTPADAAVSAEAQAEASAAPAEDASETPTAAAKEEHATEAPARDGREEQARRATAQRSEPGEELSPKVRRRRARSRQTGQAREPRSPQERHAERLIERRAKAARRRVRRQQERAKAVKRAPTGELAPVHAPVAGVRKMRQGIVVSDKAEKTITVRIDVARRHPRYEKIVRSSSTLHAHDENNDAHEGDVVRVVESRPLSRTKRWMLVDVLERAR